MPLRRGQPRRRRGDRDGAADSCPWRERLGRLFTALDRAVIVDTARARATRVRSPTTTAVILTLSVLKGVLRAGGRSSQCQLRQRGPQLAEERGPHRAARPSLRRRAPDDNLHLPAGAVRRRDAEPGSPPALEVHVAGTLAGQAASRTAHRRPSTATSSTCPRPESHARRAQTRTRPGMIGVGRHGARRRRRQHRRAWRSGRGPAGDAAADRSCRPRHRSSPPSRGRPSCVRSPASSMPGR